MYNGPKKIEYSIKDYIELEQSGDTKYEYYDGEIYALAGGTINQAMICTNVSTLLQNNLKETDCVAINSEVKIFIEKNNAFVYPDASVICGEIEVSEKDKNAITNPVLIVEVLSESTKRNDRGRKFFYYRTIPSFKEYIVVDQSSSFVEAYFKESDDYWRISSAVGMKESIHSYVLDLDLKLSDIYARIKFPDG